MNIGDVTSFLMKVALPPRIRRSSSNVGDKKKSPTFLGRGFNEYLIGR